MSTTTNEAIELFNKGFNCSQSVFAVFSEKYGLDKKNALRIGCGFGSGMRAAEICGAVSGAVLVIGLKCGYCEASDLEAKNNCNIRTEEFIKAFRKKNSEIVCRELLGCDIATPEGKEQAVKQGLFTTKCVQLVTDAVELLEELGY